MTNTVSETAVRFHRRKIPCVPLSPRSKIPVKGTPLAQYRNESPTESELRARFADEKMNIGIITGEASGGLVCRDFDKREAFEKWRAEHPDLASRCPTTKTKRGAHVFVRGNIPLLRKLAGRADACRIDLANGEGELHFGGYVVAPPSVHPSGFQYEALIDFERDIPEVDDFVAAGLLPAESIRKDAALGERMAQLGLTPTPLEETLLGNLYSVSNPNSTAWFASNPADGTLVPDLSKFREIIMATVPPSTGGRNKAIANFVITLKGHGLGSVPIEALMPVVREWHRYASRLSRTHWTKTWSDFQTAWRRLRFPKGQTLAAILAHVRATEPHGNALRYPSRRMQELVGLCRMLGQLWSGRPFHLGCKVVARLFCVDKSTGCRWLNRLLNDGLLCRTLLGDRESGKASEWFYIGFD